MIITKIAIGNEKEAFIENRLTKGFNIIFSDDNNKGKTIVMQSSLYALGNEPIFPSSFNYKDYYHYVSLRLDDYSTLQVCRKENSFVLMHNKDIYLIDSVSELKRFLNRIGFVFPVIEKNGTKKIVDPVLLFQLFFVGQDGKSSSTIFNDSYYKKEDFWNLIYSYAGVEAFDEDDISEIEINNRIKSLEEEKKLILSKNRIFKSSSISLEAFSQKKSNDAFKSKLKEANNLNEKILDLKKQRNRATARKLKNEQTLKELRSLNRTQNIGSLYCTDCGSKNIGYTTADKAYTFEISDKNMRSSIISSIQEKIDIYNEEIEACTININHHQKLLQDLLIENEVTLEMISMHYDDLRKLQEDDGRLMEIEDEIETLKTKIKSNSSFSKEEKYRKEEIRKSIIRNMNYFYRQIDPNGNLEFTDIFSKKNSVFSGCEETEFFLSKLYAITTVLNHSFPIMIDYFRDGELSTEKEDVVLKIFKELDNQKIFTATLKNEEINKYSYYSFVNSIDYSLNESSHILHQSNVGEFLYILSELNIKIY